MASEGKLAMSTETSRTIVQMRTACLKASISKARVSASKKVITLSEARLQAVSSRNMYSEQLWTVMPLAMKEWVTGSVRSKTCWVPREEMEATASKLGAWGLSTEDCDWICSATAWARSWSVALGRSAMCLAKERRLPGSSRRPWRETALPGSSPRVFEARMEDGRWKMEHWTPKPR